MQSKTFIIIALGLILLVSGCTQEQNNGTANYTDQNLDIGDDSMEQDDTTQTEPDNSDDSNPGTDNGSPSKMSSPYPCDDALLLSAMQEVFGADAQVLRKPAPFGKTISYVSCNVQAGGEIPVQIEFHETTTNEFAFDAMEDEANQLENQLFDSERADVNLGEKGYLFYSVRTNETRVFFVDTDNLNPVFVMIKSAPGTEVTQSTVTRAAEKIDELI